VNTSEADRDRRLSRVLEGLGFSVRADLRRLQAIVAIGLALGIGGLLLAMVFSAGQPAGAFGIALQTVAGLLAATQLWANRATDAVIRWTARQIEINRFGLAGLLDGSLRSFAIATAYCCLGAFAGGAAPWPATTTLDWLVVVLAVVLLWSGAIMFTLATVMFVATTFLVGTSSPRDGAVLRGLRDWLVARDWVWTLIGLSILVGALLQLSAA